MYERMPTSEKVRGKACINYQPIWVQTSSFWIVTWRATRKLPSTLFHRWQSAPEKKGNSTPWGFRLCFVACHPDRNDPSWRFLWAEFLQILHPATVESEAWDCVSQNLIQDMILQVVNLWRCIPRYLDRVPISIASSSDRCTKNLCAFCFFGSFGTFWALPDFSEIGQSFQNWHPDSPAFLHGFVLFHGIQETFNASARPNIGKRTSKSKNVGCDRAGGWKSIRMPRCNYGL